MAGWGSVQRNGGNGRQPESEGADELTAEELALLELMASDATLDGLACELGIAHQRMVRMCQSIYFKLGVETRYGAISAGFRRGLI